MNETIQVKVRFFASLRQAVGQAAIERQMPFGSTVDELRQVLTVEYPQLPAAAGAIYAAINRAYAGDSTVLRDGDEVAFFPPVSGGQEVSKRLFEITTASLSLDEVASEDRR